MRNDREVPPSLARVGQEIRAHRVRAGLSIIVLANTIGYSRPYLNNVEQGRRPPTFEMCVHLADALGVAVTELVDEEAFAELLGTTDPAVARKHYGQLLATARLTA